MDTITLLGTASGLGFLAGLRLYATVFLAGLGVRYGILHLNPALGGLQVLAHDWVLLASGTACLLELLADKVMWIDTLWDTVHTVIRPVGAALLGLTAVGHVDPAMQVVVMLLCGGVALSSHSAKAGARLLVNHSPEPFSNAAISTAEDLAVAGGTWLAFTHPVVMGVLVIVLTLAAFWLIRLTLRTLGSWQNGFREAVQRLQRRAAA